MQQPYRVAPLCHFIDEETEAQGEYVTCPNWGSKPQHGCREHTVTTLLHCLIKQQVLPSMMEMLSGGEGNTLQMTKFSANCPLYMPIFQALHSPFFYLLPHVISTPDHSAFPYLPLILQPISLFKLPYPLLL